MSLSGTIIVKKKGFEVPLPFLQLAMSNNKTCAGFAMISKKLNTDTHEQLIGQSLVKALDLSKVQTIMSNFKDRTVVMYFGSSPTALMQKAVPPYPVLEDKDGKPLVLAFLDGDCSQFHRTDSSHPDIYNAVENDLKPRMRDWYDDADGDLAKMMGNITKSNTKRADIERLFKGQGALCLYTAADEVKFFHSAAKNTYQDFDWGSTSNAYGFGEKAGSSTQKKEEPKAEAGLGGPFSALAEDDGLDDSIGETTKEPSKSNPGGDNPPAETKPDVKVDNNPKPDPVVEPAKGMTRLWFEVPANYAKMDTKKKKNFLVSLGIDGNKNKRPDGWNSNELKGFHHVVKTADLHRWTSRGFVEVVQNKEGTVPSVTSKSSAGGKDTATKHIPQADTTAGRQQTTTAKAKSSEDDGMDDSIGKSGAGKKPAEQTPAEAAKDAILRDASQHIMPPQQREAIDKWLKSSEYSKFVGHGSAALAGDPRAIRLSDDKIEDFCKQCGINLEDTFRWPLDMLIDLGEKYGYTALALLAISYRAAYTSALSEKGGADAEVEQPHVNESQAKQAGWLK